MTILQALPGVGLGGSSAILTLTLPETYAVINYRVWKVVFGEKKRIFTIGDYMKYLEVIWRCSKELGWQPQEVDFFYMEKLGEPIA